MATATLTLLRFAPPQPRLSAVQIGLRPPPTARIPSLPRRPGVQMSYRPAVPAAERLISALSYFLPFFNALHYGRFLFARAPVLALAVEPLLPLVAAYRSLPYAPLAAFFALYLLVVRNPGLSRYVRFNAMQAVVLDVLLAVPSLVLRVLGVPSRGIGLRVLEMSYSVLFVFTALCFAYGLVSSVLGRTPYIPVVAIAADRQL